MIARVLSLLLLPSMLFSQSFLIEGEEVLYSNGQIIKDSLFVFSNSNVWSFSLNDLTRPVSRPIFNEILNYQEFDFQKNFHNYESVSVKDEIYFIENKGGMVFRFQNDSISRIDRSFSHRMQIGAALLSRNKSIFRYGGYGFWSMRNFFTYFDTDLKEWEVESPINSTEFPVGSSNNLAVSHQDQVILFMGNTQDQNYLHNKRLGFNEVWLYDFNDKKWDFLGPLALKIKTIESVRSLDDEILITDNSNRLIRVLPFENKVQYYQLTALQLKTYRLKGKFSVYKKNHSYYSFVAYDNINKVELTSRNADEYFGELIEEGKLYQDLSPWRYLLILLVLPVGYYSRNLIRSSKTQNAKIKINEKGLIYKKIFFEFDEKEIEVINLLIDFDVVHSSDILALVENPNHNYSHNMRTKNQLIDKINYKLKTMLKIDHDLITSEKSKEDRRIIDYTMDKTMFS